MRGFLESRPSLFAGFMCALATELWFIAFAFASRLDAVTGQIPGRARLASIYSNKLTIVFVSGLPRTWASSCVLLKLAPFKALRPRMPNQISI